MNATALSELSLKPGTQGINARSRTTTRTAPRTSARAKAAARTRVTDGIIAKTAAFVFSAAFFFTASSLAGHVMLDQEIHTQSRATAQAKVSEDLEATLRTKLDFLARPATISDWAQKNGFVAPGESDVTAPEKADSTVVALNN